ncbi:MAG: hypothetical protein AABW41_04200 [Nanoarchaeota archaeon]
MIINKESELRRYVSRLEKQISGINRELLKVSIPLALEAKCKIVVRNPETNQNTYNFLSEDCVEKILVLYGDTENGVITNLDDLFKEFLPEHHPKYKEIARRDSMLDELCYVLDEKNRADILKGYTPRF